MYYIMTALLAIESGDLKEVATVSSHAAGVEGSSVYLRAGERLTMEELLYGALMNSGNDACVAIAEHVAGSEDIFVYWMNCKACLMGLKNTNFANTNGLPNKDHLSSAWDLATITRYALKNPVFNRIVSTRSHTISGPWKPRQLQYQPDAVGLSGCRRGEDRNHRGGRKVPGVLGQPERAPARSGGAAQRQPL